MKHKIIWLLMVFCCITNVFAQSDEVLKVLTLEEAVNCALENNSTIKQQQIQVKQKERSYEHGWNNFLPTLSSSISVMENNSFSASENNMLTASVGFNASVNLSAGLGKTLEIIKENYENGLLDYEDSLNQIKISVAKSFYSLIYMKKQVELSQDSVDSYEKQYQQTQIKKSHGLVPELDLLTSQLNLETSKLNLRNTQNSYANSLITFLNDIGYESDGKSLVQLEGSLNDYEKYLEINFSEMNIDELIENSSSVRELKSTIKKSQLSLEQTKLNTYYPSVSVSTNITPFSDTYLYSNKLNTTKDSWSLSLGLSYSFDKLIPGSAAKDNILTAEENIENYKLQLEETKKQLRINVVEMINNIEIAKQTLANCEQNVELAKKSLELAEIAYKNGSKELSALQSAQSSFNNTKVQLNNQQLQIISTIIELKNLLGISE